MSDATVSGPKLCKEKPNLYRCLRFSRDRLYIRFYAKILIFFDSVGGKTYGHSVLYANGIVTVFYRYIHLGGICTNVFCR